MKHSVTTEIALHSHRTAIHLGILAALTLVLFGQALFSARPVVLGSPHADMFMEFYHWLGFGFGELRKGNLAFWNPHVFSGAPFFGGLQGGLLYPPHLPLFLLLPEHAAINWSIALHVFLAGATTYAWIIRRGLPAPSALLAAVMYMFGGANILHVYSGYYPLICAFPWAPLLFLAIDECRNRVSPGWVFTGAVAAAMPLLAGAAQLVFYTALAAGLYGLLGLRGAPAPGRFALRLAAMALGGAGLCAIQLLPSIGEWREMVRAGGLAYDVAATFSFPPENLLTLVAPQVFGDYRSLLYWGRWYIWEMSLFCGVSGLVLATLGVFWGEPVQRRHATIMVVVPLLAALGPATPLFTVLFHVVPGFSSFRGISKMISLASLFLALLAGLGLNALLVDRRIPRGFVAAVALIGLLAAGTAGSAHLLAPEQTASWLQSQMRAIRDSGESYLKPALYEDPVFVGAAARLATRSLFLGGASLAAVALLLALRPHMRAAPALLVVFAMVELSLFARTASITIDVRDLEHRDLRQFLAARPGDYRIRIPEIPDAAMQLGASDIWGYNPGILMRYAQVLSFTQGEDPDRVLEGLPFHGDHPLLGMLRLRFVFSGESGRLWFLERPDYLPRLLLVDSHRVLKGRDEIFRALAAPSFDPRKEVILETAPDPAPRPSSGVPRVRLVDSSTDHLTVEADLESPAILLVTDAYATGWRARALPGSTQSDYRVLPANYCLRAVPLAAGHHLLRMEYAPRGFLPGAALTLLTLLGGLVFLGVRLRRCLRSPPIPVRIRH